MIDKFTNLYPASKTLRVKLLPVGKTEENFNAKLMLEKDKQRAESYKKVKEYMDKYHKYFIESVLSSFVLDGVKDYSELYYKAGKSDKDIEEMKKTEAKMRKDISSALTKDSRYRFLNKKEFVREAL